MVVVVVAVEDAGQMVAAAEEEEECSAAVESRRTRWSARGSHSGERSGHGVHTFMEHQ